MFSYCTKQVTLLELLLTYNYNYLTIKQLKRTMQIERSCGKEKRQLIKEAPKPATITKRSLYQSNQAVKKGAHTLQKGRVKSCEIKVAAKK